MAQIVRLRRSSVIGKKPTNAQLELGELSINTSDGKVFLAKSGSGGPSIEELISTNTVNTGSINLIGDVTASNFSGSFIGNGSGITNVVSSSYAVTSSYAGLAFTIESTPGATQLLTVSTPSTTWTFNHNLGEQFPVIQVYDDNGFVVIPTSIEMFSDITTIITFSLAQSGYATATVGGGLPAISSSYTGRVLQTDGVGATWEPIGSILTANKIVSGSVSASISPNRGLEINTNTIVSGSLFISGTTEFGGDLVPRTARGATLGTSDRPFAEIFVSSGSINIASDTPGDPNTEISNVDGNLLISAGGVRLLGNASFIATTGSFQYISGSMEQVGDYTQTGDYTMVGDKIISGSLYVSASLNINNGFYVDGHKQFNYGQFSDTTIQSGSSATAYAIRLNTVDLASGFSIVGGTRITAANSGTFNLQFSAQLFQTTNNAAEISIWLRKDGIDVPNSNTDLTIEKISGGGKLVAAWNYIVQLNATQYVELMWSSTRNDTQIFSIGTQSSPSRPATPSVILSMTQIA
jgi:hypothetical protein